MDLLENASTLVSWAMEMRGVGVSLMEKLSELDDPRQPSNGTRHDFRENLVIAVCAMLSDTLVGKRVWGCQHKFRLRLDPLDLAQYRGLLPGGQGVAQLQAVQRGTGRRPDPGRKPCPRAPCRQPSPAFRNH